jgi:hypothetical protein
MRCSNLAVGRTLVDPLHLSSLTKPSSPSGRVDILQSAELSPRPLPIAGNDSAVDPRSCCALLRHASSRWPTRCKGATGAGPALTCSCGLLNPRDSPVSPQTLTPAPGAAFASFAAGLGVEEGSLFGVRADTRALPGPRDFSP